MSLQSLVLLAAESGEKPNPVVPDVSEMLYGGVCFVILAILMYTVIVPRIRRAMDERDAAIQAAAEAASGAESDAERVRRDYEATLGEARAQAASLIATAREQGEAERARLVAAAEAEVAEQRQAAATAAREQREAALAAVRGDIAALAGLAAGKVAGRDFDGASVSPIVDRFLAESAGN